MKDIIRQAVADAAEWLYLERGISAKVLWATLPRNIVEAARDMRERDSSARRTEQLADFVARPVIDSVLIAGPEGEIARTGGFVGRTVMVELRTDASGKLSAREASPKAARDFNKEVLLPAPKDPIWSVPVTVTYDGAEGEGRVWLSTQEKDEPMIAIEGRENAATLAGMLIDWVQPDVVVVPRAKLEALRDKVDLCSGQELTGEEMETIKVLTDLL